MSDIFDLNNIKELVDAKHPPAVIIVDTNVLMDNRDFSKWQTGLVDPVFVLSYSVLLELVKLKDRKSKSGVDKHEESSDKARNAIESWLGLSDMGHMDKGIYLKDVGWLITVKPPPKDAIEPELDKLIIVKETFHTSDTSLHLLHTELTKSLPDTPVIFLTGEKALVAFIRSFGPLAYCSQSFPLQLSAWITTKRLLPIIDPDKELDEAVKRLEKDAIRVQLTLTGKRLDKDYKFESPEGVNRRGAIIAEGHGVIHHPETGNIGFTWRLPYNPWTSKVLATDALTGEPDLYDRQPGNAGVWHVPSLDFLGRGMDIPASLGLAISGKIVEFSIPPAPSFGIPASAPSLQSSLCVAEYLMRGQRAFEVWLDERRTGGEKPSEGETDQLIQDLDMATFDPYVFESCEDFLEYCARYLNKSSESEKLEFLSTIFSIWDVGHTVKTILPPEYILEWEETLSQE